MPPISQLNTSNIDASIDDDKTIRFKLNCDENNIEFRMPLSPLLNSTSVQVGILSSVINFNARQAIRETWLMSDSGGIHQWSAAFIVAINHETPKIVRDRILEEYNTHGDVLILTMLDSYNILAYKTAALLYYTSLLPANIQWLLKADDDTFVNMKYMMDGFAKAYKPEMFYGGFVFRGSRPRRDPTDKW